MGKAYGHPVEDHPREGYAVADSEHERIAMTLMKRAGEGKINEPNSVEELTATIQANSGYKDKKLTRKDLSAIMSEIGEEGNPYEESAQDKKGGGHVKNYTGGKSGDKYYGGGPVYPRPTKGD